MYRDIAKDLLALIEPIVAHHGLEVVDATLRGGAGRQHLQVVVDDAEGTGKVTVDACAEVSREIGRALDVAEIVAGAYMLEVCSPGVDRTLGREIDFERAVGGPVVVETRQALNGRRRFRGTLVEFAAGRVHLQAETGSVQIPFGSIARAHSIFVDSTRAKR